MTRALPALASLLALAACAPIAYVPPLIPSTPPEAGVHLGGGINITSQATASVAASPGGGVSLVARGLVGGTPDGELRETGGDVAVSLSRPLSPRVAVDVGAGWGRSAFRELRSGASFLSYGDVAPYTARVHADRVGAHVGVFFHRAPSQPGRVRVGPAVRVQRVAAHRADGRRPLDLDRIGWFVEPTFRAGFSSGPVEVDAQAGVSVPVEGDLTDGFTVIPWFGGITTSVRL